MATTTEPSPDLLNGIIHLIKNPNDRALYEGFARLIRSSPLSDKYDDAAILAGMDDILQLGVKHPVNDRTSRVRSPPSSRVVSGPNPNDRDPRSCAT